MSMEQSHQHEEHEEWVQKSPSRGRKRVILLAIASLIVILIPAIVVVSRNGTSGAISAPSSSTSVGPASPTTVSPPAPSPTGAERPTPPPLPCELIETDTSPLFTAMQNGSPFSRSSPIQRFILGTNNEFAVVKLHYDSYKSIVVLENDGTETWKETTVIADNKGEWQVYGLDLKGTRLAYTATGVNANCTSCDGYQVVDIDLQNEQVLPASTISGLANDQLYDRVFMSTDGNYAISVWESGTQVHDLSTAEEQGFTIPTQSGESILDAKIASDGTNAALYSHNVATNENTIFMKQLKSDGSWRNRRPSHPKFVAENFTPFHILGHRASEVVYCERRESMHDGKVRFWGLNEDRDWVLESDAHHGDLIDHPCHTIALSNDHRRIMVQHIEDGKNVVTIGEFDAAKAEWNKLAVLELPSNHVVEEDPAGNSLSSFDASGTFVSFLVSESHPSFPSSEHHFKIYELSC